MRIQRITCIVLATGLACAAAAFAQSPDPGRAGAPRQGFTVESLISKLSLFLPEDATRGMAGGFGGPSMPQGAPEGKSTAAGKPAQASGGQPPQLDFTRDAKLYLTRDQIKGLLPLFLDLKENPLPSPSRAKAVTAAVEEILTAAQKEEYARFQDAMQKRMDAMQKQMAANGSGKAGPGAEGGQPPEMPGGMGQGEPGRPSTTVFEMRQKQVDAFITVLRDRLRQVGA